MNWYKIIFAQKSNITIEMADYINSLKQLIYDLVDYSQHDWERIQKLKIDENQILSELKQLNYPDINSVTIVLKSKNWNDMERIAWRIYKYYQDYYQGKPSFYDIFEKVRNVVKTIQDYGEQLSQGVRNFTYQQAEKDIQEIINGTRVNLEKIAKNVGEAVSRIESWNNTPLIVMARTVGKNDGYLQPRDDASIEFGSSSMAPSFTYFMLDGKIEIDDILEGGDTEFFTDNKVQSDYFNLVKELRNPGSSQKGKILTLYTARPIKDRELYMYAQEVPSNLFLTSNYSSAEGIARDLGGNEEIRDVWKIRIDSRYLINTLDSPMEKQYQVVGEGMVPVVKIVLISMGEKI